MLIVKKTAQLNLRVEPSLLASLTEIADGMGLSVSAMTIKFLTDFVQIHFYKIQRGDITLSKPIIKKIFETIDPKRIDEIVEYSANFILSEIKSQEGKLTYEILLDHFKKWNKGRFQFSRIQQEGSDLIISNHLMCRSWSEIQCRIYAKCFESVGETIIELDFDSEESYSIELSKT